MTNQTAANDQAEQYRCEAFLKTHLPRATKLLGEGRTPREVADQMSEDGYQGFNSPQFQVNDLHRLQELSWGRQARDDRDEELFRELEQISSTPVPSVTKDDGDKNDVSSNSGDLGNANHGDTSDRWWNTELRKLACELVDQHFLTWKRYLLIEHVINHGNQDEELRAYISSGLDEIEALEEELHRRQITLADSQET